MNFQMAENRCAQSNSQFTVEIRKRKSVVYEVAVLEIGKSRIRAFVSRKALCQQQISIYIVYSTATEYMSLFWVR